MRTRTWKKLAHPWTHLHRRIEGGVLIQLKKVGKLRTVIQRHKNDLLSKAASILLLILSSLFIACTFIDILRQSFASGQFWNSIIVIGFLTLMVFCACVLHLFRLLVVSRSLSAVPRSSQISQADIGQPMTAVLQKSKQRCEQLLKTQYTASRVQHPGLQNPADVNAIEVPFWELSGIIPQFLEEHFTTADPEFKIPASCSLNEFIQLAIARRSLDPEIYPVANRFVEMYDVFRFGGHNVSKEFMLELINALKRVVNSVRQPENPEWFKPEESSQGSVVVYRTGTYSSSQVSPRTAWQ